MNSFDGVRVFESALAITRVAAKKSKNKRIQKKFIKKFGYKYVPGCIQTPMGIFMHPVLFAKLKEVSDANNLD